MEKLRNQKGFTLIEIIAVLVILGILAAVAIPKYQSLQVEAGKAAARGAISAVQGALTMKYSQMLLSNPGASFDCTSVGATDVALVGLSFAVTNASPCVITGTHTDTAQTATGNWARP